jgi:hypothetical protein
MSIDEIYAKLVTIERLLSIVLSDSRYSDLLNDMRSEIHDEFGAELNKLFPSDPAYACLHAVVSNFDAVADQIAINHRHQILK